MIGCVLVGFRLGFGALDTDGCIGEWVVLATLVLVWGVVLGLARGIGFIFGGFW